MLGAGAGRGMELNHVCLCTDVCASFFSMSNFPAVHKPERKSSKLLRGSRHLWPGNSNPGPSRNFQIKDSKEWSRAWDLDLRVQGLGFGLWGLGHMGKGSPSPRPDIPIRKP